MSDTDTDSAFRPVSISPASTPLAAHYFGEGYAAGLAEGARIARMLAPLLRDVSGSEAAEIVASHTDARAERVEHGG